MGSFITTRNISKDEEVFSNYGPFYASVLDNKEADQTWYYDLWQDYKKQNVERKDEIKLFENAAKRIW